MIALKVSATYLRRKKVTIPLTDVIRQFSISLSIEGFRQDGCLSKDDAQRLLQKCETTKSLDSGKHVQSLMVPNGLDSVAILCDYLIRLFAHHEYLLEANQVFNKVSNPSIYSWAAIILANTKLGQFQIALELFHNIQFGVQSNRYVYIAVLKACTLTKDISHGRVVHDEIITSQLVSDVIIGSMLLHMYATCRSMEEACRVFKKLPNRDLVLWSTMIVGYTQHGNATLALHSFDEMKCEGLQPDVIILLNIINACSKIAAIECGRVIHVEILERGTGSLELNALIFSTLVDMYFKCGSLEEAWGVFSKSQNRDAAFWNTMILGSVDNGKSGLALECFDEMQNERIEPDKVTFLGVLKACSESKALQKGRFFHNKLIDNRIQSDIVLGSTLIHMYNKCGCLGEAHLAFGKLQARNVVAWSTMIEAYVQHGEGLLALQSFMNMQYENILLDKVTFLSILKACSIIGKKEWGRLIHEQIIEREYGSDIALGNTLVDMYAKCGSFDEARKVFNNLQYRDVVSWNALIAGYVQHGNVHLAVDYLENMKHEGVKANVLSWSAIIKGYTHCGEGVLALECFEKMQQEGTKPDVVIYSSVLKACVSIGAIVQGKSIHDKIIESGLELDVTMGNIIVDMYAKSGNLEKACHVFYNLAHRDVVSWGVLIEGYVQNGDYLASLELFDKMQKEGIRPDNFIFVSLLKACANLGALENGRQTYSMITSYRLESDVLIGSAVVVMYSKCGMLEEAQKLFDMLPSKNMVSWNALITGYAQSGKGLLALECFKDMQQAGVGPDEVSIISVLTACSYTGLVDEGLCCYKSLKEYDILPTIKHSTCMVDLLCRAGFLEEAEDFLCVTMDTDIVGWTTLLSACRVHGNIKVARCCFSKIIDLDLHCAAGYVLISNIYANLHIHKVVANKTDAYEDNFNSLKSCK